MRNIIPGNAATTDNVILSKHNTNSLYQNNSFDEDAEIEKDLKMLPDIVIGRKRDPSEHQMHPD